jgi:hypothetical protein
MQGMRQPVHRLVARLFRAEQPPSRNRHFDAFADPVGWHALRSTRQLRSLARDIVEQGRRGQSVRVESLGGEGQGVRIALRFDRIRAKRWTYLSQEEYELLLDQEAVRRVLAAG